MQRRLPLALLVRLAVVVPILLIATLSKADATCDSACHECKKSCTSQKLGCLTHARADRTSALGDCTPGRAGGSCRRLARQTFGRERSECGQTTTTCRSCCKRRGRDECFTTTTTSLTTTTSTTTSTTSIPTTSTSTSAPPSTTTTTTTSTTTTLACQLAADGQTCQTWQDCCSFRCDTTTNTCGDCIPTGDAGCFGDSWCCQGVCLQKGSITNPGTCLNPVVEIACICCNDPQTCSTECVYNLLTQCEAFGSVICQNVCSNAGFAFAGGQNFCCSYPGQCNLLTDQCPAALE
jgi:hypothetical protein